MGKHPIANWSTILIPSINFPGIYRKGFSAVIANCWNEQAIMDKISKDQECVLV